MRVFGTNLFLEAFYRSPGPTTLQMGEHILVVSFICDPFSSLRFSRPQRFCSTSSKCHLLIVINYNKLMSVCVCVCVSAGVGKGDLLRKLSRHDVLALEFLRSIETL